MFDQDFRVEYVETDYSPRVIRKQIWDEQTAQFVPRSFVQFSVFANKRVTVVDWLKNNYGPECRYGSWWQAGNYFYMNEKIATWYALTN
jgi:hypothetical protein